MMPTCDDLKHFKIFDSHFHVVDRRFPLVANNGYLPADFTCEDYLSRTRKMRLVGGAIVAGSFQAFDQGYLRAALGTLGSGYVGVAQLPVSVSDAEILNLDKAGVRGVRFNLKRGSSETLEHLERMAGRIFDLCGWHVELYVDAKHLPALYSKLVSLPALSIDHLGLSKQGFHVLLKLVERGARVKATGFGRVNFDVGSALRYLHAVNPQSLMFGTDLPSTRAPRPYSHKDLSLIVETLGEAAASAVLYENAIAFYRPAKAS